MAARLWGIWTRDKLDLLRRYLKAFAVASQKSRTRLYLDLFGGQTENKLRRTNEILDGSARIALQVDNPAFTTLRFFELEPHASRLRTKLRADFTGRDLDVIAGDCNETIGDALRALAPLNRSPTFAFIDPNGPDVHWSTLEALSKFKHRTSTKVEIWLLLPVGLFTRNLRKDGTVLDSEARKLTRMYGTEQWRAIFEARLSGQLEPSRAREEYVNLMRWRLETVLGYQWTHALDIKNERGSSIYHMVFATDHKAGHDIMSSLYNAAMNDVPLMREEADRLQLRQREEASGVYNMFGDELESIAASKRPRVVRYRHEPPSPPYGSIDDAD